MVILDLNLTKNEKPPSTSERFPNHAQTPNDAFLGQACANQASDLNPTWSAIRSVMREFLVQRNWDAAYVGAHIKMSEAWMVRLRLWSCCSPYVWLELAGAAWGCDGC